MYKYVLISLVSVLMIFFASSNSFSQTKFGFRGGLNLANVSEDLGGTETIDFDGEPIEVEINQSNRTTFQVGGLVEIWVSPMFALQLNALYNQKGVKLKGDFNTTVVEQGIAINIKGDSKETIKLTYLSFPVLAKLAIGQSKVKPYIIAGPEIGFLLSAKDAAEATAEGEALGQTTEPITVSAEEDIKESLETFEFALDFGAGLTIPLGSVDAFVEGQYSLGLTKVNKESDPDGGDLKNQVIMINLGLLFGGK